MAKVEDNGKEAYRLISAFFESVDNGTRLLKSEPGLMNERTGLGETPLHYLAVENQLDAVRALVEYGADVNTVSEVNGTPLAEATRLGHTDLVKYLLSVNAKLWVEGQDEPVLHHAVRSGNIELVQIVIDAGAEVTGVNDLRETPLHLAAASDKDLEIVRLLIRYGADLTAKRIFDETPLAVAQNYGADSVAAELIKAGAPL